jgi:tetratricopeptide (TPR) repeat protein
MAQSFYELERDPMGRMNVWIGRARLEAGQGDLPKARQLFESVFALAEELGFGDHPVTQDLRREYAQLNQRDQPQADAADKGSDLQAVADLLIGWIETADWAASQAYLTQHAEHLLTDDAERALQLLQRGNPQTGSIPQHLALLQRSREVGIEQAYQELQAFVRAAQDPAMQAMQALLQVKDAESFEAALTAHPALKELPTLQQLAGVVQQAHRAGQPALAQHGLELLLSLFRIYNYEHADQIEPEAQAQVIDLHEALLPPAEALAEAALLAGVRESASWALNTLGNHYAQQGEHAQAVETYTQAIAYAPQTAMLYRNRAGEYLERQQYAAARQDIDQAAGLEPEAARLPELWRDLYLGLGDGAAMLPYAQQLQAAHPEEASHPYYLALALALAGDLPAAAAAMMNCSQTCSDDQREQGLLTLAQLQAQHPSLATTWQELVVILQNKSNPTEERHER